MTADDSDTDNNSLYSVSGLNTADDLRRLEAAVLDDSAGHNITIADNRREHGRRRRQTRRPPSGCAVEKSAVGLADDDSILTRVRPTSVNDVMYGTGSSTMTSFPVCYSLR